MKALARHEVVASVLALGLSTVIGILATVGGPASRWLSHEVPLWLPLVIMILFGIGGWLLSLRWVATGDEGSSEFRGREVLPSASFSQPQHDARVDRVIPYAYGWVGELATDRRICVMVKPHGSNEYWLQCGGPVARHPNGSWHAHDIHIGNEHTQAGKSFDLALVLVSPKALAALERYAQSQRGTALPPGATILSVICVYRQ